jgi:Ca-activated chloride channel family protein
MMLMSPGRLGDPSKVIPKDVVFVLDKSGSMKGEKIEQAKGALAYCIDNLNGSDRFNIVLFSTNVTTYSDRMVEASRREKNKAEKFIEEITARGGTDINNALLAALEPLESDRPRMVIFLTDGLPTVGESNIQTILSNLRKRNDSVRIFPFGVGYDVNTVLLDQLSADHHGAVDYIRPEEDIEVKVSNFYDKVSNPVLSKVELNVAGVELLDYYPKHLPDIFDGTQLIVLGRYSGTGSRSITLSGDVGGRDRKFDYEGTFERRSDEFGFIPRIWANRKIAYLLSEIKLHGAEKELIDEVIELSLEHGIITPYTSYLILEEGSEDDRDQLSRTAPERVLDAPASASPRGGRAEEMIKSLKASAPDKKASGEAQVGISSDLAQERERSNVVMKDEAGAVRYAAGKRFVLRGKAWIDEAFEVEMDVTEIEFLSEQYFELLDKYEDVEQILALGENVAFVLNNHAYRISS